jgi:hypothetical protein
MAGAGGAGTIPVGTGLLLKPDTSGWVAGTTNSVGIQGSFYTFSDAAGTPPGTTTIAPATFTAVPATGAICVSGSASAVLDGPDMLPAYGQYWGGGVGFNLADPGAMMPLQPWSRGNVVGFSFNITGTTIPVGTQFRFKATFYEGGVINEQYCASDVISGANTFMLNEIVAACWELGGAPMPITAQLGALQWQVATVEMVPTPFNFCIENLTALTQ